MRGTQSAILCWRLVGFLAFAALRAWGALGPGSAIRFDGVSEYLKLFTSPIAPGNGLTVEVWIHPLTAFPSGTILRSGRGSSDLQLAFDGSFNLLYFVVVTTTGRWELSVPIAPADFSDGLWHHLAATYDGDNLKLYRDGALLGSTEAMGNPVVGGPDVFGLALQADGTYHDGFRGELDEVRVWSVAREAAAINETMNRPLLGNEAGLEAYWRLDEGGGGIAHDATGHGHDAQLINFYVGPPDGNGWTTSWAFLGEPLAKTFPAIQVTTNAATLRGEVNPYGSPSQAWFDWGAPTPAQGAGSGSQPVAVSYTLTNLIPSRFYSFRCAATNNSGAYYGNYTQFLTLGPPLVTTLLPTALSPNGGQLKGSVIPNGFPSTAWFEYGTNTNYGFVTVPTPLGSSTQSIGLSNVVSDFVTFTTVHYRLVATNALGTNFGSDVEFRTIGSAGTALQFNGLNTSVSLPVINLPQTSSLTLEAWVQLCAFCGNGRDFQIINLRRAGVTSPIWVLAINSAQMLFGLTTSGGYGELRLSIDSADYLGKFEHIAATYDDGMMRLYHNGHLIGGRTHSGNIAGNATDHSIGFGGAADWFNGQLDEVRIWSVARSQDAIDQARFQRLTGLEPGLAAYWRFDETVGTVAADATPNHLDGTLVGPPLWVFSAAPIGWPHVTTLAASLVSSTAATLNGQVNPDGFPTSAWFEWGAGTNYGSSSSPQDVGSGLQSVTLANSLTNLLPDTTYHFRLAAQNPNGAATGDDQTFVLGPKDKALSFNGANAYVQLAPLFASGNQLSLEAWVKPADLTSAGSFEVLRQQGFSYGYYYEFPDWMLTFKNSGATLAFGLLSVPGYPANYQELQVPIDPREWTDGRWHHVAATYDGTVKRLYHNGVLLGSSLQPGPVTSSGTAIGVGAMAWGRGEFFNGLIDEVRIWQATRAQGDLIQSMNRPLSGVEPGLAAYLRFNEGTGDVTADGTAHGNNGTLIHGPAWSVSDALYRPYCVTLPVTNISNVTAGLNGAVDPEGLELTVWFEYGATTNYGSRTPSQPVGHGSNVLFIAQTVSNLLAGTDYYCRCVGSNAAGLITSPAVSFLTSGPQAVTLPATARSDTSMTLNGSLNPRGLATKFWFEWGTNTFYGFTTPVEDYSYGVASAAVSNLAIGRTYHFRIAATNAGGLAIGQDETFTPLFAIAFSADWGAALNGYLSWADYDRDGDLDLLLTTGSGTNAYTTIYRNEGGPWTVVPRLPGDYNGGSAGLLNFGYGTSSWGDYNNDGAPDLLLTGLPDYYYVVRPNSHVFRNDNGVFTNAVDALPVVGRAAGAWADYDNDGWLDFVVSGSAGLYTSDLEPTNSLYHNNGDGTFTSVPISFPAVFDCSLAWSDFNNDGRPDLLITGDTGDVVIARVYRNDGGGVFTDIAAGLLGVASGSAAWGDFDGDGWPDILLAGSTNRSISGAVCKLYRNNHDGTFTDVGAGLPGVFRGSAAWGDYDNDGQLDILLSGVVSSPAARLYHNDGGVFIEIGTGLSPATIGPGVWGDFDGDGKLDLALIGSSWDEPYGLRPRIFRSYAASLGPSTNRPTAPTGLAASVQNNGVRMNWNASLHSRAPSPGLTYNLRVGTAPGGGDIVPPQSDLITGQRRLPQMGNAEHRLFATLANLPVGTYFWSAQTVNHAFVASFWAPERTFSVTSAPPAAVTLAATNILCCSVWLQGTATPSGLPCRAWFEWGTTTNFGNVTTALDIGSGLLPQSIQQQVANLPPLTTCYFRLVATNQAGVAFGATQNLTTLAPGPVVVTVGASNLSYTSVLLLGACPPTSAPADYFIEWGPTTDYGSLLAAMPRARALRLDGLDDFVAVGWGRFPQVTNNFTIELWANPTAARAATPEELGGVWGIGGQRYAVFPDQGGLAYGITSHAGAGLSVGANGVSVMEHSGSFLPAVLVQNASLSGWNHLALVYSNHVPVLYLNGAMARTGLVTATTVHPSANLGGATNSTYGQFEGALQELRVWDVPLSAATIQAWMSSPLTTNHPAYSHLQGYWPLNEGQGTFVSDLSPRGEPGELINGPSWSAVGWSANSQEFSALLLGLAPGSTYHFRAVATNISGAARGANQTFTTWPLPRLLSLGVRSGPNYYLQFSGTPGNHYWLESSTNLAFWVVLSNLSAGPDGFFDFLDTSATNLAQRFYRLRVP